MFGRGGRWLTWGASGEQQAGRFDCASDFGRTWAGTDGKLGGCSAGRGDLATLGAGLTCDRAGGNGGTAGVGAMFGGGGRTADL
ncbi:MAG: hypothetical protein LBN95_01380 [Prevotellaceae bacterium]|nr:hypothetical protein [Prevotellaceae bacterium]